MCTKRVGVVSWMVHMHPWPVARQVLSNRKVVSSAMSPPRRSPTSHKNAMFRDACRVGAFGDVCRAEGSDRLKM